MSSIDLSSGAATAPDPPSGALPCAGLDRRGRGLISVGDARADRTKRFAAAGGEGASKAFPA